VAIPKAGADPETIGDASGGISGRTIDFTINWDAGGTTHYTGDVAESGWVYHGTATHLPDGSPMTWRSSDKLACTSAPLGTAVVKQAVDIYDAPDGVGNKIGGDDFFLTPGRELRLVEPCRDNWCHLVIPEVPGGGWGWVYQDPFLDVKSP
jgi:hypothetical protein